MLRVGLTGGIASGKSRVLRRFAERGCRTLDLDLAARDVTGPGTPALAEIEAAFGRSVLDAKGLLDRTALAARVFGDAQARARLNAIVHPRVRALEAGWARAEPATAGAVLVTDGALLVEAGVHLRFDRLVVVHCPPAAQLQRLQARDGLAAAAARARIEAQMPSEEKRDFAHFEIDSSGAPEQTDHAADLVFEALRRVADEERPGVAPPVARLLGGLVHGPRTGPRGLSPVGLLRAVAETRGLELQALAEGLHAASGGPWYRAARQAPPGAPAAALGSALVAWALATGPPDAEFLVAAAASLARLTHEDAAPRAEACLFTLLLQEIALRGSIPDALEARARALGHLAERWGGGVPSQRLLPVLRAALAYRGNPAAARAATPGPPGDGELAGALVGAAVGASAGEAPELAETLGRLQLRGR